MSLDDVAHKIKLLIIEANLTGDKSAFNNPFKMDMNISKENETSFKTISEYHGIKMVLENWTAQHQALMENYSVQSKMFVIFWYCLIILVSFFGNSIVCKIVFWNSSIRSITNVYIGTLSISDLLMTVVNVPLQLTQILSRNWPLNQFFCKCLPFIQGLSVNVSSFTMACIALDRYQLIAHPLRPRAVMTTTILKIIFIWILATIASSPYPFLANVEEVASYNSMTRCRLIYPNPEYELRQLLTVFTLLIQYLIPLSVTGVTYFKICKILWRRKAIGVMSEKQRNQRYANKWKSIKMLIIVFLVFAFCWFPINVYHIYQDFRGPVGYNKHNSRIFLTCHWLAMSSICYNPFLYCWLNDSFRAIAKSYLQWFLKFIPTKNQSQLEISSRRRVNNKTTSLSINFSTLSESLNFRSISKVFSGNQCSKNSNVNEQEYEFKCKPYYERKLVNIKTPIHFTKSKKSRTDTNIELEVVSSLKNLFRESIV